jgi:type I restriction enzyme S subunit
MADREKIDGQYPYYGASGVIDYVDDYLFEGPHLLIGEDGANLLARSSAIAFMANGRFWVNNHAHVLAYNGESELRYLEFFIESIDLKRHVSGSAQPKLTQKNMNDIPVPTPPLDKQKTFVEVITGLEQSIKEYKDYSQVAKRMFISLQHRAFRGEL